MGTSMTQSRMTQKETITKKRNENVIRSRQKRNKIARKSGTVQNDAKRATEKKIKIATTSTRKTKNGARKKIAKRSANVKRKKQERIKNAKRSASVKREESERKKNARRSASGKKEESENSARRKNGKKSVN